MGWEGGLRASKKPERNCLRIWGVRVPKPPPSRAQARPPQGPVNLCWSHNPQGARESRAQRDCAPVPVTRASSTNRSRPASPAGTRQVTALSTSGPTAVAALGSRSSRGRNHSQGTEHSDRGISLGLLRAGAAAWRPCSCRPSGLRELSELCVLWAFIALCKYHAAGLLAHTGGENG